MKKAIAVCVVLIGLAPLAVGARKPWLLRFSGGLSWISPDDLNVFLRDYVKSQESAAGSPARGAGFRTVGRSSDFEATLLIPVDPRVHILAGFGVLRAPSAGGEFAVTYPAVDASYVRDDMVRSAFGRLGIAWTVPIGGRLSLRPYAAGELHRVTFEDAGGWTYVSLTTGEKVLWMDWRNTARALRPGFAAGIEVETALVAPLRISLDAGYRLARLSGFKGDFHSTWNYPGGSSPTDLSDRPLYYYEYADYGFSGVRGGLKLPDIWGGARFTLVRDAVIDLSGLYLKAGLTFAF
jgi:hypothetical protein